MSETKEIKETKEEDPKTLDLVGDNVALLKSKIMGLEALVMELTGKLDEVNTKYAQAKEFMDDEAKAELLAFIAPRYNMSKELLVLKDVDELKAIKLHIDNISAPVFKSGTKMDIKKPSQKALLESTKENIR